MNELLEFFISFNTMGLAEVQQGITDLQSQMSELGKNTQSTGSNISGLTKKMLGIGAAFFSVSKLISDTFKFNNQVLALYAVADAAGVAAENVESLGLALQQYGGDVSSAGNIYKTLENMRVQISQGKITDSQREAMARYGVNYMGRNGIASADEMLRNLAQVMPGLNAGERMDLARAVGLDTPTMLLLSKGIKNLDETLKENGKKLSLSGSENRENAVKLNQAMNDLTASWNLFISNLSPVLTQILDVLTPIVGLLDKVVFGLSKKFGDLTDWAGRGLAGLIYPEQRYWNDLRSGKINRDEFVASMTQYLSSLQNDTKFQNWIKTVQAQHPEYLPQVMSEYENMQRARRELLNTNTSLNTGNTVNSRATTNVNIGAINVKDDSGNPRQQALSLTQEIKQRFSALQLTPSVLTRGTL